MKRKNNTLLRATAPIALLALMQAKLGGMTVTSIKQLLRSRRVQVNGAICTRGDQALQAGDEVTILSQAGTTTLHHPKLSLVYEDDHLLVVNKRQGLLTVPSNPDSAETTALSILKAYVRRQHPRNNVFVVHRLDRETSGLLVFAKSPQLQEYMRTYWRQLVTKRTYIALAEGVFDEPKGTITTWLTEDKRNAMVFSSPVDDGGQKAITHYEVLGTRTVNGQRPDEQTTLSLVALNLETGRTNQIRVHLASIGHPVVGDRKYGHGNTFSPVDRLCLHARILEFIHPATEQVVHFETPIPKEFKV
ncbi:MAG: RluA family pseudouridine synthase [Paludibacteraceae bacterium]|nr:RluA family pseudouridine synthase [Paludibacteraceae bacterium]MBO7455868.1 RluA family pseudouridine synthase [Paludibacteraceae bacterium]